MIASNVSQYYNQNLQYTHTHIYIERKKSGDTICIYIYLVLCFEDSFLQDADTDSKQKMKI